MTKVNKRNSNKKHHLGEVQLGNIAQISNEQKLEFNSKWKAERLDNMPAPDGENRILNDSMYNIS